MYLATTQQLLGWPTVAQLQPKIFLSPTPHLRGSLPLRGRIRNPSKAPFTLEQCWNNTDECYKSKHSFDKVDTTWMCSICFDFVKRTKFHEKLVRHCCQNDNNVESTFDFVEATVDFIERIVRLVAFDNIVSTLFWCGRGLTQSGCRLTPNINTIHLSV